MVLVAVLADHVYDDRARRVGEHYRIGEAYLSLMLALGWVALLPRPVALADDPAPDEDAPPLAPRRRLARLRASAASDES